jgi:predicted 3-demethylubiquinone-9 3-methyltransferase (glyoxalase superfamily)
METHVNTEPLSVLKDTDTQRITPFLWFDNEAMEAAEFYANVFKNGRVKTSTRYNEQAAQGAGVPKGTIMTVIFEIEGQEFVALNGGPVFKHSPAVSFFVHCRTRSKVDDLWTRLCEGGKVLMELDKYPYSERYGWVEDKFGISWQIMLSEETPIIVPCLMFTGNRAGKAEEAINYYMSVFNNASVDMVAHYEAGDRGPQHMVKYAAFTINGQKFAAMDNAINVPFGFSPAISFVVNCNTQQQIDYYWDKLTEGGDINYQQCGWLQDKYGVSWQVVPEALELMLAEGDTEKAGRMMGELMSMKKLDLARLKIAYEGAPGEKL